MVPGNYQEEKIFQEILWIPNIENINTTIITEMITGVALYLPIFKNKLYSILWFLNEILNLLNLIAY
jgi:hypothetical protein